MPKVGSKHFSYTKAGYAAAKKEAAKTGKKMTVSKKKGHEKTESAAERRREYGKKS
jgi:hypothetical protein